MEKLRDLLSRRDITSPASGQKAKGLEPILTSTQMESYRQQQALQSKLVKDIWTKMGIAGRSK